MKTTQAIHVRLAVAIQQGRKRIRCVEGEFETAAMQGIRDPKDNKKFIAALSSYDDCRTGFFANISEAFRSAAKKVWHIESREVKK